MRSATNHCSVGTGALSTVRARFRVKPDVPKSLCRVAAQPADAQHYAPELKSLLLEQDANVFLILPRLVLLCGLTVPRRSARTESFLPHYFGRSGGRKQEARSGSLQQSSGKHIAGLISALEHVNMVLGHCDLWHRDVLMRRAILGAKQESCADLW